MTVEKIDGSSRFFECSNEQRLAFEAGIKMGTIYHQFIGTPVSESTLRGLERSIEDSIGVQPFVESVTITITLATGLSTKSVVKYTSLTAEMIVAEVILSDDSSRVLAKMEYNKELDYPLMSLHRL